MPDEDKTFSGSLVLNSRIDDVTSRQVFLSATTEWIIPE